MECLLIPEEPASLAPILPLFNAKVIGIRIRKAGKLKVDFGNDLLLEVNPHEKYEAWQLGCSSIGLLLVCSPGGPVSVFRQPNRPGKPK